MKMKKLGIVLLLCLMAMSGCGRQKDADSAVKISGDSGYIADAMSISQEYDKEFYLMRVKDDYIEIPGSCNWVYLGKESEYPPLEDGQIAYVKADVSIYYGGVAGYTGNLFIDDLKQYEIVSYEEADQSLDFPDAASSEYDYANHILKYEDVAKEQDGNVPQEYLIVLNRQYIEVYCNGEPVTEYEYADSDGTLDIFWTEVIGESLPYGEDQTLVTVPGPYGSITVSVPEGWSYEICNVDDETLLSAEYGIQFFPEDAAEGYIEVGYHSFFGVCGMGLDEEEIMLAGEKAMIGYYDGNNVWDYVAFQNEYSGVVAMGILNGDWSVEELDGALQILDSLVFDADAQTGAIGLDGDGN